MHGRKGERNKMAMGPDDYVAVNARTGGIEEWDWLKYIRFAPEH